MNEKTEINYKKAISWSFYDWANSAFATTIMAGFFPVFFKKYWSAGSDASVSTFQLGIGNSIAGILVALMAPFLGAVADKGSAKKKFLLCFAFLGVLSTFGLYFVQQGAWPFAILLYIFGSIGFSGGNIFYDALIVFVTDRKKSDFVSAMGYSLGYLGGGLLFAFNVWMTLRPATFGLPPDDQSLAVRISFLSVAGWWALFSIPIFLFVEEPKSEIKKSFINTVKEGWAELLRTLSGIRHYRNVFTFLIAFWLYIDGVDTIILMAVDYGVSLGLKTDDLLIALLITQFVGFPAALLFGKIGEWMGSKAGLMIALIVYSLTTIYAYFMTSTSEFYVLAIIIGLVQGGIQSLSRSLFTKIIPHHKSGEFFGFYNMLGKFAVVLGPAFVGTVSYLTGNPRLSILVILFFFIVGGGVLYLVDEGKIE